MADWLRLVLPVAVAEERDALARGSSVEEVTIGVELASEEDEGCSGGAEDHQSKRKVGEERIGEADDLLDQGKQEHARDPDDVDDREAADVRVPVQVRRAVLGSPHHRDASRSRDRR